MARVYLVGSVAFLRTKKELSFAQGPKLHYACDMDDTSG